MLKAIFQAADRADQRIDRWLTGGVADEVRGQASTWGTWPGDNGSTPVTQTNALKLLAVTGSVQLLTESIATLPVDVFRKTSTGRSEVTPPAWMREPAVGLSFIDWCTQVLTSLLLHGNAFLVVTRNATGTIAEVIPVDPQSVTVDRSNGTLGGRKRYIVRGAPFNGEMVHIKGMMLPGSDVGLSPLEFAHQSIRLGLAAKDYNVDNFESGLKMPGVIEYPGNVDAAKMGETAKLWQRMRRKGGHGLPGVLEGGGTFKQMGLTNKDAQMIELSQWNAAEICAQVYLIDPRELGIPLTGSTLEYVNSESRLANLVRKGMLRWITRIEGAVSSLLPSPQYMKMNVSGFQRADSGERWDTYLKASQINAAAAAVGMAPVLLTDEMRGWENLDPLPAVEMDVPDPADEPADDMTESEPSMNSAEILAEIRTMTNERPITVHVTTPDVSIDPTFNFTMPDIDVDARSETPVVHVAAPVVTVEAAAPVEVRATRKTIEHTADGRIAAIIEEPV